MKNQVHYNWSQTVQFSTSVIKYPSSVQELSRLIRTHSKIHVAGTFHCFNNIADSSGVIVSLSKMKKICTERPDSVHVEAGCIFTDLRDRLLREDRAIANFPSLPHLNIVGAIVTGTHGGGLELPIIAGMVQEFEILDGKGVLHSIDSSSELFSQVLVGLGFLGIITAVRLSTVPAFSLQKSIYSDIDYEKFRKLGSQVFATSEYTSVFVDLNQKDVSSVWFARLTESAPSLRNWTRKR